MTEKNLIHAQNESMKKWKVFDDMMGNAIDDLNALMPSKEPYLTDNDVATLLKGFSYNIVRKAKNPDTGKLVSDYLTDLIGDINIDDDVEDMHDDEQETAPALKLWYERGVL